MDVWLDGRLLSVLLSKPLSSLFDKNSCKGGGKESCIDISWTAWLLVAIRKKPVLVGLLVIDFGRLFAVARSNWSQLGMKFWRKNLIVIALIACKLHTHTFTRDVQIYTIGASARRLRVALMSGSIFVTYFSQQQQATSSNHSSTSHMYFPGDQRLPIDTGLEDVWLSSCRLPQVGIAIHGAKFYSLDRTIGGYFVFVFSILWLLFALQVEGCSIFLTWPYQRSSASSL